MRRGMIFVLVFGICAGVNAQEKTSKSAMCAFVEKVVTAAPGEFNSFKGAQDPLLPLGPGEKSTIFKGTLEAGPNTECKLYVRRGSEMELPPLYSCHLTPFTTLSDSKPVYEKAVAELRACFPNGNFEEQRKGDESKREEFWHLKLVQPGFEMRLELADIGRLADMFNRQPSGKPGVLVSLDITDTAPAPEEPKSAAAKKLSATVPMCQFIDKVLAASTTDYAAIRAVKADAATREYEGKLKPNVQSMCKVLPASGSGKHMSYVCELRRAKTMAEIRPEYDRLQTELPSCFSNFKFKENIIKNDSGEKDTRDEMWFFTGKNPRYRITMQARDDGWRLKSEPEKVDPKTKVSPVFLILQIQSLP